MQKNRIGLYQTGVLTFFLTRTFFIAGLIPLLFQVSGVDSLLSILLGSGVGVLIAFFFSKMMERQKEQTIFEAIDHYFPKAIAFVCKVLILLVLLLMGSFLLFKFSLYINNNYLTDVNPFLIMLTFFLVCLYLAKGKLETIARSSEILAFVFIILFVLSLIGVIPFMDPERLKPFFSRDFLRIGRSCFSYGLFTSLPLFLLTMIPKQAVSKQKKLTKAIMIGYLCASLTIFLTFILMIGTLGIDLASYFQFPQTAILKKISFFSFIERVEGILAIGSLLDLSITFSFLLYTFKKGISSFVDGKWKTILFLGGGLFLLLLAGHISFSLSKLLIPLLLVFLLLPLFLFLQMKFSKKNKT